MNQKVSGAEFVGREPELEVLLGALDGADAGEPGLVLLGGDAGVGKSRLVAELCRRARNRGSVSAVGCAVPTDGGLPYGPVVGVLRDLHRQLGDKSVADLLGLVTAGTDTSHFRLADSGRARSDELADRLARTRLFESILQGFADLGAQASTVLVFEDLHWADSATTDLIGFLARNLSTERVLLLVTYRSEELGRGHPLRGWLNELVRHQRVTRVGLNGLERADVAALIGQIIGHSADWTLVDAVWSRSGGNPFFVEELTAARHSVALPDELRDVVTARLDALPAASRRLLAAAAVSGMSITQRLLEAIDIVPPESLNEALTNVVDRQMLVVDAASASYQFRHALLREAVYGALLPGDRQQLHRAIATVMARDPSTVPLEPSHQTAALAAHWWAADEWEQALELSLRAAEASIELLAFPEASDHFDRALAAHERVPSAELPVSRGELLEEAADAAYLAGRGPRSVELIRTAIASIDKTADPETAARCYVQLGRNAWAVADAATAFDAYRAARELLPPDRPTATLARALAEEARGLMLLSREGLSEQLCHQAIAAARAAGARAEESHALNTLGCCQLNAGRVDEAVVLLNESLELAEKAGSIAEVNRAYANLSHVLLASGQLEAAASVVFDSANVGERLWGVRLNGAAGNSVEAMVRLGRYEEADVLLAQMRSSDPIGMCATTPYLQPVPIAIRRGRYEEAHRLLTALDELTAGLADVQLRGSYHLLAAELAADEGRPDDAIEELERGLDLAAGTDDAMFRLEFHTLTVRALADAADEARASGARFDLDKARLMAADHAENAQQFALAPKANGGVCLPHNTALAAEADAQRSRLDQSDPELWAAAVQRWQEAGEPYPEAYCSWREAEALLEQRSGRDRAVAALEQAWHTAVRIGAERLTASIEDLAQRARIRLRPLELQPVPPSAARDLGLTPRETEVLGHLAVGETDREIAEALFISKKTASVHVSNLLRKLDASSRIEAGRIGRAHGLGASVAS